MYISHCGCAMKSCVWSATCSSTRHGRRTDSVELEWRAHRLCAPAAHHQAPHGPARRSWRSRAPRSIPHPAKSAGQDGGGEHPARALDTADPVADGQPRSAAVEPCNTKSRRQRPHKCLCPGWYQPRLCTHHARCPPTSRPRRHERPPRPARP